MYNVSCEGAVKSGFAFFALREKKRKVFFLMKKGSRELEKKKESLGKRERVAEQ